MFIRIERGAAAPISRQILEQIRAQCLAGALKPGASLPSVRQLACQLAVNVNTVVRVYERLAADKLVEMRQGDGTYVLPQSPRSQAARQLVEQREQFARELEAVVRRGLLLGFEVAELRRMLSAAAATEKSRAPDASHSASSTNRTP